MNLRWLWFDFIPPELGLTRAQKRYVRAQTRVAGGTQRVYILMRFGFPLSIVVGTQIAARGVFQTMAQPAASIVFGAIMVFAFVGAWILTSLTERSGMRPSIHRSLQDLGYRTCGRCRYWLRGLNENTTCPECGFFVERLSRLSADDLNNPEMLEGMRLLGNAICHRCGLLTHCPSEDGALPCPECGAARDPMPAVKDQSP